MGRFGAFIPGGTFARSPPTHPAGQRRLSPRSHLRALAQRVEVADKEVRIMGWKSELLRELAT
jgi:hypothetical protein